VLSRWSGNSELCEPCTLFLDFKVRGAKRPISEHACRRYEECLKAFAIRRISIHRIASFVPAHGSAYGDG